MIDNEALRERYNPEGSKLRNNQKELLNMLLDLDAICKEHNIEWWLSSGTLLGAARHEGFIPWDDDVDIVMTRREVYQRQDWRLWLHVSSQWRHRGCSDGRRISLIHNS